MRITKWHMAMGIVAAIALTATSAYATHVFNDVEDGRFFAEPAEWAATNGITNGCGNGNFCPGDPVTRGENITFAKRYDDNIVQPALTDLENQIAALQAELDAAEAEIATNVNNIANLPDVYFAEVAADGTLERNTFGVVITKEGTGLYAVQFPVDNLPTCTWSATIAQKRSSIVDPFDDDDGEISLTTDFDLSGFIFAPDPDSILVETRNSSGTLDDRPFHLLVTCGLPTLTFVPPIIPGVIVTLDG